MQSDGPAPKPPTPAAEFGLHDSGARQEFQTGSRRDTAVGKPEPDLISPLFLLRLAAHLTLGAQKYGRHNWSLGQPSSRYRTSLGRHLIEADLGLSNEDHLAAIGFNLMGIIHNQEMVRLGHMSPELHDYPTDWCGLAGGAYAAQVITRTPEETAAHIQAAAAASQAYKDTLHKLLKK